jgi:hypothetical protein
MSSYRIYCLDECGALRLPEEVSAASDQQALAAARLRKFHKCEVWEGRRLVACLDGHRLSA